MQRRSQMSIALLLLALPVMAGDRVQKGKYQAIEVAKFDVAAGVVFPPDYQISLTEDVLKQLEHTRKFQQVLRPGDKPSDTATPRLKLMGTITKYKAGSRATRYLVGFGAGATKIVAAVKFVDSTSGEVLLERRVDGKVIIGIMGGNSMGATNGLAKEVAKVTRKTFF